jgi:type VI protein secretion system component VasK
MTAPPLPPKPELYEKPRGSWLAILLAGGVLFLVVVGLTFLTLGYFGPVIVVAGIMGGVVLFHYLVWGWWLEKILRQAKAEEDAQRERDSRHD